MVHAADDSAGRTAEKCGVWLVPSADGCSLPQGILSPRCARQPQHTIPCDQENAASTLPNPRNSILTWSPGVSHTVLTRLPVSTISPARRCLPPGGEMVGEPGECVVGMAEHVRAAALPGFNAVDERAADDAEHVRRGGPRHRLAEHAAGGEKVVRHQRRSSQRLPMLIAVIDNVDCRKIFLHGSRGGLSRKWCRGSD